MDNNTEMTRRSVPLVTKPGKQVTGKSSQDPESKMDHKMLMIVFVSLVIDLLAFTMILPLLPTLLDYYGHNEVRFINQIHYI